MNNEIFKPIPDYEGIYEISNFGNVKSINYNNSGISKLLSPVNNKKGYMLVMLCKNGKLKNCRVHRLVATVFITNPENKPQINHIDGNKQNNHVNNLEWCTNTENQKHSYSSLGRIAYCKDKIGIYSHSTKLKTEYNIDGIIKHTRSYGNKRIDRFDSDGNYIDSFSSIAEASRVMNVHKSAICQCCNGKNGYKSAGGYIWKYGSV